MTIQDFLNNIDSVSISNNSVKIIENVYGARLNDFVRKVLSAHPDGYFFDGDDVLRLLSTDDIVNAKKELHIDFISLMAIPFIDIGENNFVVYLINENKYAICNITDGCIFKKRDVISDIV